MLKKRVFCLCVAFVMLFSVCANALDIKAKGAVVINGQTGEIYYEKNAYTQMTPASLTKIMTLYMIFEKIAEGEVNENTLIPVSENAAKLSRGSEASNVPLTAGTSMPLHTLLDAITIVSACASCTVIAEYFSGNESAFAGYMTTKAQELGIDAHFYDASGLSNNNTITPMGIATLIKLLITKYPDVLKYTSKTSAVINGKTYKSTNQLLENAASQYSYPGVDGFKTGTTTKAGKCLAATVLRNGERVISVVMNAPTTQARYTDSQALINKAFSEIGRSDRNLFSTDIRTYINGNEIPCTYKHVETSGVMVLSEDLESYGFDITYDENFNLVYIMEDKLEDVVPVTGKKIQAGKAERKFSSADMKVYFIKDSVPVELKNVVLTDKGLAISFDELGLFYEKTWDDMARAAYLNTAA